MNHSPDYLFHLLGWTAPVLAAQWVLGPRPLWHARRSMGVATLISTSYLSCADAVAIRSGIWGFGARHLLGLAFGPVPLEEVLFFAATSLLVSQGFVLIRHALLLRGRGARERAGSAHAVRGARLTAEER